MIPLYMTVKDHEKVMKERDKSWEVIRDNLVEQITALTTELEGLHEAYREQIAALKSSEQSAMNALNLATDQIAALERNVKALQRELEQARDEVVRMKEHTWCAYCGLEIHIDDEAATKISKHIMEDCPTHPIRIYQRHSEALEEQVDLMKRNIKVLKELVNDNAAVELPDGTYYVPPPVAEYIGRLVTGLEDIVANAHCYSTVEVAIAVKALGETKS